jgi:bifunctional DNase/RNase
LAARTGSPIFVAEDVFKRAGADIPQSAKTATARSGVEDILREIGEQRQKQAKQSIPQSPEEFTKVKEEIIADVFKE